MLTDLGPQEPNAPAPSVRQPDPLTLLLRAAAQGDRSATRRLLDAIAPTVARAVRGVLGRAHPEIDDVTQVALVGFVRALGTFRGECQTHHFAARIATRAAMEARRRARLHERRHDALDALDAGPDDPEGDACAERRRALLQRLLEELPDAQAEAMALRVIMDYSLEETAEATGAPVNTVRSRIRLAREALRVRIEADPRLAELLEGVR